ncbi:MAG: F0F1 ATP synthase subunit B [Candidatus Omnitrophica bacterium]|nr:F0F1 ATP synthase subunit B [Candidatus Omnitrophota bacterium]
MQWESLINPAELAAQVISFLVLLFLLKKFFWAKMFAVLDSRKRKIADELDGLTAQQQEIAGLKADLARQLARIEDTARVRIAAAVDEGRMLTDEMRKKAYLDAQLVIENTNEMIRQKILKAETDLKEKIIELSLRAAEFAIQEKFTEAGDRKLIEDFLKDLDRVS